MTVAESENVRCPRCGNWIMRIDGDVREIEANCSNSKCRTTVIVAREGGQSSVRVLDKVKQA